MAKYSKKAAAKVGKVMKEMKAGKLKSSSGEKVTNPRQAIAIGISEAREAGYKVPAKKAATKKSATKKKSTPRKAAAKKKTAKKTGTGK
jgi:hypothetical protein